MDAPKPPLTFGTKDDKDINAQDYLAEIGRRYVHTGNGKIYTVRELVWDGATDQWAFVFMDEFKSPRFVRTISNFMGKRENGEQRFIRINEPHPAAVARATGPNL